MIESSNDKPIRNWLNIIYFVYLILFFSELIGKIIASGFFELFLPPGIGLILFYIVASIILIIFTIINRNNLNRFFNRYKRFNAIKQVVKLFLGNTKTFNNHPITFYLDHDQYLILSEYLNKKGVTYLLWTVVGLPQNTDPYINKVFSKYKNKTRLFIFNSTAEYNISIKDDKRTLSEFDFIKLSNHNGGELYYTSKDNLCNIFCGDPAVQKQCAHKDMMNFEFGFVVKKINAITRTIHSVTAAKKKNGILFETGFHTGESCEGEKHVTIYPFTFEIDKSTDSSEFDRDYECQKKITNLFLNKSNTSKNILENAIKMNLITKM